MSKKKEKAPKPEPAPSIMVGEHGRYQIKSGRLSGEYVARAFPKPPAKARGMIAEATGATEEAAIAALHEAIDARENRRVGERRTDDHSGTPVPSVEEYVEAIAQVALSAPQMAMLTALSIAGEDGLTETKIAGVAGYKSRASANKSLAGAGLLIGEFLSIETASTQPSNDPEGTSLLGYRSADGGVNAAGKWILHAELRDAVRAGM
ncbi:hypothetical protein N8I71_04150 [Roseibacterium sp. SDUM158016]|uniref:hypothetical protein n=1 Tax=Roseicyclus sediminis TaxID=2980997 RepID=UPI0021D1AA05|nr:hypothetical protein [Roseibacterium sp. SDUM158016]MCU4652006.1 hypothetical protein [Roseibacterium sp. SDUM158016]